MPKFIRQEHRQICSRYRLRKFTSGCPDDSGRLNRFSSSSRDCGGAGDHPLNQWLGFSTVANPLIDQFTSIYGFGNRTKNQQVSMSATTWQLALVSFIR